MSACAHSTSFFDLCLRRYPNIEAMGHLTRSEVDTLWDFQRRAGARSVKFGAWPTVSELQLRSPAAAGSCSSRAVFSWDQTPVQERRALPRLSFNLWPPLLPTATCWLPLLFVLQPAAIGSTNAFRAATSTSQNVGFDPDVTACSSADVPMAFTAAAPLGGSGINPTAPLSCGGLYR